MNDFKGKVSKSFNDVHYVRKRDAYDMVPIYQDLITQFSRFSPSNYTEINTLLTQFQASVLENKNSIPIQFQNEDISLFLCKNISTDRYEVLYMILAVSVAWTGIQNIYNNPFCDVNLFEFLFGLTITNLSDPDIIYNFDVGKAGLCLIKNLLCDFEVIRECFVRLDGIKLFCLYYFELREDDLKEVIISMLKNTLKIQSLKLEDARIIVDSFYDCVNLRVKNDSPNMIEMMEVFIKFDKDYAEYFFKRVDGKQTFNNIHKTSSIVRSKIYRLWNEVLQYESKDIVRLGIEGIQWNYVLICLKYAGEEELLEFSRLVLTYICLDVDRDDYISTLFENIFDIFSASNQTLRKKVLSDIYNKIQINENFLKSFTYWNNIEKIIAFLDSGDLDIILIVFIIIKNVISFSLRKNYMKTFKDLIKYSIYNFSSDDYTEEIDEIYRSILSLVDEQRESIENEDNNIGDDEYVKPDESKGVVKEETLDEEHKLDYDSEVVEESTIKEEFIEEETSWEDVDEYDIHKKTIEMSDSDDSF